MFSQGPLKSSDAYRLDRMESQLRGLTSPIVCGAFGMVRGADGRPIIYSLATATAAATGLTVCGTADQRRLAAPTDTQCPPCDTQNYVRTFQNVTGLLLDPCFFKLTLTSQCGGGGDSSSGSSAEPRAVQIEGQGFTGTWPTPWDLVFCPDTCEIKIQWAYGCFYKGLFLGYWLGPAVGCGGASGSGGGFGAAAPPLSLLGRAAPPLDPAALPEGVRAGLPDDGGVRALPGRAGRAAGKVLGRLVWAALALRDWWS